MRHTVQSEHGLPQAKGPYVRCSSEPTVVSHPFTGDAYVRADGAPWEHAGYWNRDGKKATPATPHAVGGIVVTADTAEKICADYWRDRRRKEAA